MLDFVQDTEKFLQEILEMPHSIAANGKVTLGLDGRWKHKPTLLDLPFCGLWFLSHLHFTTMKCKIPK